MSPNPTRKTRPRKSVWGGLIALAALAGGGWALLGVLPDAPPAAADAVVLVQAERGPMRIAVNVEGNISSADAVEVRSQVDSQVKIEKIVEEGTVVKAGDVIIELASSDLQERYEDQLIALKTSESQFVTSQENKKLAKLQGDSEVATARLDYEFAQEDVTKYLNGEYPQLLRDAESQVLLREANQKQAQEKVDWSRKLFKKDFITRTELDKDELDLQQATVNYAKAKGDLDLLKAYTYPRQKRTLEADVVTKKVELARTEHLAKSRNIDIDADLLAKKIKLERDQRKAEWLKKQVEACTIKAPIGGMVIYSSSSGKSRYRREGEPIGEGAVVYEGMRLIKIPRSTQMMADVRVHESQMKMIRVGQRVQLSIMALPDQSYVGRVIKTSRSPNTSMSWLNPDLKYYNVEVEIEGDTSDLLPGMSCRAEVLVQEYEEAVSVPVQAVGREKGQPVVYMPDGDGFKSVPVEVGLDNNVMVRIVSGLQGGEEILSVPPIRPTFDENPQAPKAGPAPTPVAGAARTAAVKPQTFATPTGGGSAAKGTPKGAAKAVERATGARPPKDKSKSKPKFKTKRGDS